MIWTQFNCKKEKEEEAGSKEQILLNPFPGIDVGKCFIIFFLLNKSEKISSGNACIDARNLVNQKEFGKSC